MAFPQVSGELPLRLPGRFHPWSIEFGHSKFLLRGFLGDPEGDEPLRVFDVLFQDVSRISVSDRYVDLRVSVASPVIKAAEEARVGAAWEDSRMFLLGAGQPSDYVIAGYLFWAEVAISGGDPSPLLLQHPAQDSVVGALFRA